MRIVDYLAVAEQRLAGGELEFGHGTDNPWDEAVYLVFCSLGLKFDCSDTELERELDVSEVALLDERLEKRVTARIPVAYLVGEAWFAGQPFFIDQRALIPRSPIAELVARQFEPLLPKPPQRILDLCTGNGCIGIACALAFADARVDLADLSTDALALAARNVERHGLGQRVAVRHSDLFASLDNPYDLIVSNPPYVSAEEMASLPREYHHEPVTALLSEDRGLAIPLKILAAASDYLTEDGVLVMEVGFSHPALQDRLPRVPLLWLDFEHGGEGVFTLTRQQLRQYRGSFN